MPSNRLKVLKARDDAVNQIIDKVRRHPHLLVPSCTLHPRTSVEQHPTRAPFASARTAFLNRRALAQIHTHQLLAVAAGQGRCKVTKVL